MYEYYNTSGNNTNDNTNQTANGNGTYSAGSDPNAARRAEMARQKALKKANSKKVWGKIGVGAAVGLAFGIMAGGAFQCVNRFSELLFPTKTETVTEETVINEDKEATEIPFNNTNTAGSDSSAHITTVSTGMSVSDVAASAMPSVVSITNKSVQQVRSMWGMGVQEYESTSVGSGIIIGKNDEELLIVTNNHVIEGSSSLTVGFVDDEIYEAYTKGKDSDRDLAVVAVKLSSISEDTLSKISIAVLGDSSELEVGEQVVAIGNALGYGQSVTTGIISALDREVTIEDITNNLIQTDAAINPGNSGGALLNMNGELIGINSAKFASSSVEGMGYAIPIETVKPIVEDLMNRETRELLEESEAGYLGITGLNVDSSVSSTYGIPEGVYLQEIAENSPAEAAGLIKGDVITKFDGSSVDSISELKEMLLYYAPGEKVKVTFYRADNGEYSEKTVVVTLGDRKGTALDPDNSSEGSDDAEENDSELHEHGDDTDEQNNNGSSSWGNSIFDFNSIFNR